MKQWSRLIAIAVVFVACGRATPRTAPTVAAEAVEIHKVEWSAAALPFPVDVDVYIAADRRGAPIANAELVVRLDDEVVQRLPVVGQATSDSGVPVRISLPHAGFFQVELTGAGTSLDRTTVMAAELRCSLGKTRLDMRRIAEPVSVTNGAVHVSRWVAGDDDRAYVVQWWIDDERVATTTGRPDYAAGNQLAVMVLRAAMPQESLRQELCPWRFGDRYEIPQAVGDRAGTWEVRIYQEGAVSLAVSMTVDAAGNAAIIGEARPIEMPASVQGALGRVKRSDGLDGHRKQLEFPPTAEEIRAYTRDPDVYERRIEYAVAANPVVQSRTHERRDGQSADEHWREDRREGKRHARDIDADARRARVAARPLGKQLRALARKFGAPWTAADWPVQNRRWGWP